MPRSRLQRRAPNRASCADGASCAIASFL
jgi:hypothetical protein